MVFRGRRAASTRPLPRLQQADPARTEYDAESRRAVRFSLRAAYQCCMFIFHFNSICFHYRGSFGGASRPYDNQMLVTCIFLQTCVVSRIASSSESFGT